MQEEHKVSSQLTFIQVILRFCMKHEGCMEKFLGEA
jgi:hypothetical protein